jgi:hypothetical protein
MTDQTARERAIPNPVSMYDQDAARLMYSALREANPHLPDPKLVTTSELELRCGADDMPTLTLEVFVAIPESFKAPIAAPAGDEGAR